MNINFTDPNLASLLNLLTTCGWRDMASDDMEAIAERADCDFHYGASKGCFLHAHWDFVLKVPLYADEDIEENYCEKECEAYLNIVKNYPTCAHLFAPIEFLGWYGEMPVYVQDKVYRSFSDCHWRGDTQEWYEKLSHEAYTFVHKSETAEAKEMDIDFHSGICGSRLCLAYFYFIFKVYGYAVCKNLMKWITETDQDDLHEANIGITADFKPVIFDYSGFEG